jgi:hypothetical protein
MQRLNLECVLGIGGKIGCFMLMFGIFKNRVQRSNINSAVNIACKFKCY